MANSRISSLTSLGGTPNTADIIPITDISDTTGSAQGTTKKVTVANLISAAPQGDLLASNNLSDVASATTSRTNLGLGTAATTASTDYATAFYNIVTKTADYTLTNAENGKVIFCNSTNRIDITVPSGLTSGFNCRVVQGNTGAVSFVASSTTINGYTSGSDAPNGIVGQHGVVDIVPVGSDAYKISGEIGYVADFNTLALSLDGTDDYMSVTQNSAINISGDITLSAWVNRTSTSSYNAIFTKRQVGGSMNYQFTINNSNGQLGLGHSGGSWVYNTTTTLSTSTWYHVAVTVSSGTAQFYIDGVAKDSFTGVSITATTQDLIVGATVGYNYFGGLIDEASIFNSALSSSNITTIYNSGVPSDISSLSPVGWWRMGDGTEAGSGTTVYDMSSNSNNGTLTNGPTFSTTVPS